MNQKGFKNTILVLVIVIFAGASGRISTASSDHSEYPSILKPLQENQLSNLRSEFEVSNKNICTQINEYGLTESKSECFGEIVRIEIIDEASIVERVQNWLIQNSKFTGVISPSDAIVDRVIKLDGCIECKPPDFDKKVIGLRIDFRGQTYNDLPLEGDISSLTVFANAKGISRVDGHRFPIIPVPLEPKISETSAKSKLNGRTFTYGDIAGNPRNYRVEQKDLSHTAHKVLFVKKSPQGLEFRLAWKVLVGQGLSWTVYMDAVTGEELNVVQMFQT